MSEENLRMELRNPHLLDPLSTDQENLLKMIKNRRRVEEISEELEVGEDTVYRMLRGLFGEKQGIPNKYRVENPYLKIADVPGKWTTKYELNHRGWQVVAEDGVMHNSENRELSEGSKKTDDVVYRPHFLRSRHKIKRKNDSFWGSDAWFYKLTQEDYAETEDGNGVRIYWNGFQAEVYRKNIVIRIDFPKTEKSLEAIIQEYKELREQFIDKILNRFNTREDKRWSIQIRSEPEMVDVGMDSNQEWAELENAFADMIYDNPELQDDVHGSLFQVFDQRNELIATIDCSTDDRDGNPAPEFEYVHGQEARNHIKNMKDLITWGAYYEITPKDFRDLQWLRENIPVYEKVFERLGILDELEDRVSDLERVQSEIQDDVVTVAEEVSRNRDMIEQNNGEIRSELSSREEILRTHVENTEQELSEKQEKLKQMLDSQGIQVSENSERIEDMGQDLDQVQDSFQDRVQKIRSVQGQNLSMTEVNARSIENMALNQRSMIGTVNEEMQERSKAEDQLLQEVRELKQNTLTYQVRKGIKSMATSVVSMIL